MRIVLAVAALVAGSASVALANPPQCRVVDVDFTPTDNLQMVAWIEDTAGKYWGTIFITDLTGRHGLGNRPGRMDFNSAWRWPYGRRENVFPVWSHRQTEGPFPKVYFQDDDATHQNESDLSHPFDQSSPEAFYCRPLKPDEPAWDAQSCASIVYTDKGVLSPTETSLYPPRDDLTVDPGVDDPSVSMMAGLDPFDVVSEATPLGGQHYDVNWSIPQDLPSGDYVLWVEVSKEFDDNQTYNATTYPAPSGILYGDYGAPYRGQPSVVYSAPFQIGPELSTGEATTYAGYGDPDGADGTVRPPDTTISTDVPGSGGARLLTTVSQGDNYRMRVRARLEYDSVAPSAPTSGSADSVTSSSATVSFVEPGDDAMTGSVEGYEVRYRADQPITDANFSSASTTAVQINPDVAGTKQTFTIPNLLPQTHYWVGIRAYDDCHNTGPLAVVELTTADRQSGEVSACFVATAAYGSYMAEDVEMLRHFRDSYLRSNVVGELLVEAYYTFGPALAGVIGESDDLRGVARDVLDPLVDDVRGLSYPPAPSP